MRRESLGDSKQAAATNSNPYPPPPKDIGVSFINVARESGLSAKTIFGGEHKNKYLLETTGCGVAFYDYDNDDWLDIFLVNGWRLEGFPKGQEPVSRFFKNNRDGTFTDVTKKAGLIHYGWGHGESRRRYERQTLEHRLRVRRLRSRQPPRSFCGELHRS
jgi:hypothetical protein